MGTSEGKVAFITGAGGGLCSDAARYITGIALPIDAGNTVKKG